MRRIFFRILFVVPFLLSSLSAFSQDEEGDVYDPFIDYSEFEEAGEEEADVNFFRNGRLFTAGLAIGQRSFTEGMSEIFADDMIYGIYLSYFFDLRMALQFSYLTGNHAFKVVPTTGAAVIGEVKMSHIGVDMKYYFNTQNVTKGLAAFNPYLLAGFSSVSRESNRVGQTEFGVEKAFAFDAAAGVEFPLGARNDMYLGLQGMFQLVNFKNESTQLKANGADTGKYANGDLITLTAILGLNF